jgi:hypothetical protein
MNSEAYSLLLMLRSSFRDSRTSSSTCCVAASEEACEPRSSRPFALGTAFTYLESMALSVARRETGNRSHRTVLNIPASGHSKMTIIFRSTRHLPSRANECNEGAPRPKMAAVNPSHWLLARLFACQTFARLLKYTCCYEQLKLFQPGRNPLLFACLWKN